MSTLTHLNHNLDEASEDALYTRGVTRGSRKNLKALEIVAQRIWDKRLGQVHIFIRNWNWLIQKMVILFLNKSILLIFSK